MTRRHARAVSFIAASGLVLAIAPHAIAQTAGPITSGVVTHRSGDANMTLGKVGLSVAQLRSILASHHPGIIDGTSSDEMVTIVVDSLGGYVSSVAAKAPQDANESSGAIRTTTTVRRTDGAASASFNGTSPAAGTYASASRASEIPGLEGGLIKDIAMRQYSAGELGPNGVRIRLVTLAR